MTECALAKNGWTSNTGVIRYDCHSDKKNSCEICNRIICKFHTCYVHAYNLRYYTLKICDECIVHNVQCTIGGISYLVQDRITQKTLSNILSCYSGILTKPCKKIKG